MKKNLTFALLISFLFSFNFTSAQQMFKFIKWNTLKINPETKLWDMRIPLSAEMQESFNPFFPAYISYVGADRTDFPAILENGELVVPEGVRLFLRKGQDYYFQGVFYDQVGVPVYTNFYIFYAPNYFSSVEYKVNDWNIKVVAEVKPPELLYPSSESYFSTVPCITDSIIYGKFQDFEAMLKDLPIEKMGYEYCGAVELFRTNKKKLLNFVSFFKNENGDVLLYDIDVLFLMANVKYTIEHNLTGEGAFVPYLADNIPRKAQIIDMAGRVVRTLKVVSGEPIWMSYDPSGKYFLSIEGVPWAESIIKI